MTQTTYFDLIRGTVVGTGARVEVDRSERIPHRNQETAVTSKAKTKTPSGKAPAVKNKLMSGLERSAIADAAAERAYKPAIDKAIEARNEALRDLLHEIYDESCLKALAATPRSLIHTRRAKAYEHFRRGGYSGHRLDIMLVTKKNSEFLFSQTLAGIPELLPRDAMPHEIVLNHSQRQALRLAKDFIARCGNVDDAEMGAKNAKQEIYKTLQVLKRSGAAAEALPEIADIIGLVVGRPPQALIESEQVAKVRSMLKVAA